MDGGIIIPQGISFRGIFIFLKQKMVTYFLPSLCNLGVLLSSLGGYWRPGFSPQQPINSDGYLFAHKAAHSFLIFFPFWQLEIETFREISGVESFDRHLKMSKKRRWRKWKRTQKRNHENIAKRKGWHNEWFRMRRERERERGKRKTWMEVRNWSWTFARIDPIDKHLSLILCNPANTKGSLPTAFVSLRDRASRHTK